MIVKIIIPCRQRPPPPMDIALLRTFLEVARTRHFGRAANNLFVTQSAVSARIKLLETTLGVALFDRRRNDIRLTAAGERLNHHAAAIVRAWGRAKAEVTLRDGEHPSLCTGCVLDLWATWVRPWVNRVADDQPELAVQVEVRDPDALARKLIEGSLDLAFVHETPHAAGLHVVPLGELNLRLYATRPGQALADLDGARHVGVDWGGHFNLANDEGEAFPARQAGRLRVSQGSLALDLLLDRGGSAYLPESRAAGPVADGRLHPVADAPMFHRQVLALHRAESPHQDLLSRVLGLF